MRASAPFVALGLLLTSTLILAVPRASNPSQYNDPNHGTPVAQFAADSSLPGASLATAAKAGSNRLASFELGGGGTNKVGIYGDWAKLNGVGAYFWTADMDVDCDGIDYKCQGNEDGQDQTNFGALSAYAVPFAVIPDSFAAARQDQLEGNNIFAIFCDGKLLYGIFGDTDGDDPEAIGEASWLMARSCFPNDGLNGGNGHTPADVTYIVFTGSGAVLPDSAHDDNYITDFGLLRSMGDSLVGKLVDQLGL